MTKDNIVLYNTRFKYFPKKGDGVNSAEFIDAVGNREHYKIIDIMKPSHAMPTGGVIVVRISDRAELLKEPKDLGLEFVDVTKMYDSIYLQADYDNWYNGRTTTIGEYTIKPKGDMCDWPQKHGWVVCKGGCNILPGATWAHTTKEATELLHCYIIAEGKGDKFWALVQLIRSVEERITDKRFK